MSARTDLAAWLTDRIPAGWSLIDHDASPTITRTTVMVWVENVAAGPSFQLRTWTIPVLVLSAKQTAHEDDLEAGLATVLDLLDDHPHVTWSAAEYVIYADTWPAYRITAQITTKKEAD